MTPRQVAQWPSGRVANKVTVEGPNIALLTHFLRQSFFFVNGKPFYRARDQKFWNLEINNALWVRLFLVFFGSSLEAKAAAKKFDRSKAQSSDKHSTRITITYLSRPIKVNNRLTTVNGDNCFGRKRAINQADMPE